MASIQSLGIGSVILTTKLVEDLVSAERSSVDLRLNLQTTEFEAEISAFGTITESVESLRVATAALSKPGATDSLVTTSSDPSALTATTTSVVRPKPFEPIPHAATGPERPPHTHICPVTGCISRQLVGGRVSRWPRS